MNNNLICDHVALVLLKLPVTGFLQQLNCWLHLWFPALNFSLIIVRTVIFFFNYLYRYETLVGTIGKKFLKKRDQRVLHDEDEEENSNTKPKKARKMFLKPQD